MEDAHAVQDGQNVMKEGFKMILLDGRLCYGIERNLKGEDER